MAAYRQFITYRLVPDPERAGKTLKLPTHWRTGYDCKPTDPANWCSYDEAHATGRPVGFVFTDNDPFFFHDVDDALAGGQWSQRAVDQCAMFAGAAVEVSQSGAGLHIFGTYTGTLPDHSCKNLLLHMELYHRDRFVALTDMQTAGNAAQDCTAAVHALIAAHFPPAIKGDIAGWTDEPVEEWDGPKTDEELLKAALASGGKSFDAAFSGQNVTFRDLWEANADALAKRWPGRTDGYGASEADAALAGHLAFWTGKNCERIRTLMDQSALKRSKWERADYIEGTIMRACAVVKNVAKGRPAPPAATESQAQAAGVKLREGERYLSAPAQVELFKGVVYVVDANKVWVPGTGVMVDKARFDIIYGGAQFIMDDQGQKKTDSAWDAFTRSPFFEPPTADRTCFRPEYGSGAIIQEDGWRLVNSYIPILTPRRVGDPGPFLRHLAKMIPDERDRAILLHYMARCIQSPGFKAQWWPVIQGAEGNGKTLIERIMAFCIGFRYSHLVNPEAMAKTGNQFNDWIAGNLWVGIEEIYVGNDQRNFLDNFKATVTNDRIATEGKGASQKVGDNRCNGIMLSNHAEAVPISVDTRRYAVFLCAQQDYEDMVRDGMTGGYFPDLYDWFYGRNQYEALGAWYGASVINEYLRTYVLSAELDPAAMAVRAPVTTSRDAAVANSRGSVEMEIMEAIEQGRSGFAGGWVSSMAIDRLLDGMRSKTPRNKRRDMMKSLGFIYHPAFGPEGRVNNVVQPDNGKPRLFIKQGHIALNITEAGAAAAAYTKAQNTAQMDDAFGKAAG